MRNIFLCIVAIIVVVFVTDTFAQEIKVIEIQGDVLVRPREISPWRRAAIGETLFKDYELLTKAGSQCSLSFDVHVENVVTVGESSQIKIADIIGRDIELSRGRVFSLIDTADKGESFQIKTPTAIAGARGTGWMVDFGTSTLAKCFQGIIYVKGLDKEGNPTSELDIEAGSGIEVFIGGMFGDLFDLSEEDKETWEAFYGDLTDLKGADVQERPVEHIDREEIQIEQNDDFREEKARQLRLEAETPRDN